MVLRLGHQLHCYYPPQTVNGAHLDSPTVVSVVVVPASTPVTRPLRTLFYKNQTTITRDVTTAVLHDLAAPLPTPVHLQGNGYHLIGTKYLSGHTASHDLFRNKPYLVASLLFSACMYFCMALNLQLVLVHGVNRLMMEKYYLVGSSLLVAVCNITPLAVKGQFGFYDDLCWFSNPDPALRYRWLVGTQSFWLFLMASSELVCFVILILYMLRRRMVMRRIHSEISSDMTRTQHAAYDAAPILQFRAIILRITLYPLLSCVLGFSGTTLDLWLAKHVLENTELKVKLTALDQCIFNARPFLYALLAATDPSFLRAVVALRPGAGSQRSISTANSQQSAHSTTQLFSWTPADGSRGEVESSISMATRSVDGQTEANVHHICTHRDPAGIERHSNVESCKDSIEYQI
ncbi:hypothetical protein C8R45DRAFT_1017551 [Mycena sanguinolenta]|nr:hypothetical protein C8R45DRAFT_1017551 [Mycena sanguinolenta]